MKSLSGLVLPNNGSDVNEKGLGWLDALTVRFRRTVTVAPHLAVGLRGEEMALFYLRRQGYIVVARRWKTPKVHSDVDLIAWEGETLCFIEVKTRSRRDIVPAEFAVDQQKQKMLRSMASVFRKRLPEKIRQQTPIRFDIVSVYMSNQTESPEPEIELFRAAFAR